MIVFFVNPVCRLKFLIRFGSVTFLNGRNVVIKNVLDSHSFVARQCLSLVKYLMGELYENRRLAFLGDEY